MTICPCGCGGTVQRGNTYAEEKGCANRGREQRKSIKVKPPAPCPCGCGKFVKPGNRYAAPTCSYLRRTPKPKAASIFSMPPKRTVPKPTVDGDSWWMRPLTWEQFSAKAKSLSPIQTFETRK